MGSIERSSTSTTTIRLTSDERAAVVAAAEAVGLGPSSFARFATVQAAGRIPPTVRKRHDTTAKTIAPFLGELGRIGSNINQIARVANSTGDLAALSAAEDFRADLERLTVAVLSLREVSSG